MIKKIKQWWKLKRPVTTYEDSLVNPKYYTRIQMEKIYALGVKDGRKEGLAIARDQAAQSLKEILKQQNKR